MSTEPVERSDGAADLRTAMSRLPVGERDVVSLVCCGLTYRQAAEQFGLAEGVVTSLVRRALMRLAQTTQLDGAKTC
ncbi:MAG: sigma factor-like helix-turn-helix DNA-binding protein [Ilumatobacteraceae bacterium]